MDCIFCKIIDKEISSKIIYEDEQLIVINDIDPKAPVHFLIMPKEHISSNEDITDSNSSIVGYIFSIANKLAKEYGLKDGYRIVNNCKDHGGQTVNHIHFHLLGGRQMLWPPG